MRSYSRRSSGTSSASSAPRQSTPDPKIKRPRLTKNIYLTKVAPYVTEKPFSFGDLKRYKNVEEMMQGYLVRPQYVDLYAWAVPNAKALRTIAKYGPIVEIGAGTGYWAALLQNRKVDVKAYDLYPVGTENNIYHTGSTSWTTVDVGGPEKAALYPDRALMLCWPPFAQPMALQCLEHYKGDTVLYIGEWDGCTADEAFHQRLEAEFDVVEYVALPVWQGMHDGLYVCKRKP